VLVVGLGNLSRRDDGLGFFAVNAVRARLGLAPLGEYDDGLNDLGHEADFVLVPQLSPELAETAAGYDRLVLMDARVVGDEGVELEEVGTDASPPARLLSHEMYAAEFVALIGALYGRKPRVFLVSVKGRDYDFGVGLSEEVKALLPLVVERVLALTARA
jgi:hydrogenase maturation protease